MPEGELIECAVRGGEFIIRGNGVEIALSHPRVRITPTWGETSASVYMNGRKLTQGMRGSPVSLCRCHPVVGVPETASFLAAGLIFQGKIKSILNTKSTLGMKLGPAHGPDIWDQIKYALAQWLLPIVQNAADSPPPCGPAEEHARKSEKRLREGGQPALIRRLDKEVDNWLRRGGTKEEFDEAVRMVWTRRVMRS